jgi:hypothetical protein
MRAVYFVTLALGLAGCQTMPESFAPPIQRRPLEEFRPYRATRVVNMIDSDAPSHFVTDITPALAGNWRWALKRPTVWLRPRSNQNVRYSIDFTLPGITFKDTGPVTMSFYVGDHLLEKIRYVEPGQKKYEKPVPPEWIVPGEPVNISAEIDKMWTSPTDGATFGFILTSIGLL